VVFSMPTASTPNPPLTLVNLPIARVDWERTNRYAQNARATRYVQMQAEADYAQLSNEVAATLNDVAHAATPAERLAIVDRARKTPGRRPGEPLHLPPRGGVEVAGHARGGDRRPAGGGGRGALPAVVVGFRRPARRGRAAAAAADAEGGDRAGA